MGYLPTLRTAIGILGWKARVRVEGAIVDADAAPSAIPTDADGVRVGDRIYTHMRCITVLKWKRIPPWGFCPSDMGLSEETLNEIDEEIKEYLAWEGEGE